MTYSVGPLIPDDARRIFTWRYPEPYSIYDMQPGDEAALLDPALRYHAARDVSGTLVGYYCFGADAQVPVGRAARLYDDSGALHVGLGMRPDLTGAGRGREFLEAGLAYAQRAYEPAAFRLTVAAFNERARRLYESTGFREIGRFESPSPEGGREFLVMVCPARRTGARPGRDSDSARGCGCTAHAASPQRRTVSPCVAALPSGE